MLGEHGNAREWMGCQAPMQQFWSQTSSRYICHFFFWSILNKELFWINASFPYTSCKTNLGGIRLGLFEYWVLDQESTPVCQAYKQIFQTKFRKALKGRFAAHHLLRLPQENPERSENWVSHTAAWYSFFFPAICWSFLGHPKFQPCLADMPHCPCWCVKIKGRLPFNYVSRVERRRVLSEQYWRAI